MRMEDTICALSTPQGMGGIAVIRISGTDTFPILKSVFKPRSTRHQLENAQPYSLLFGEILDKDIVVDEVMVGIFKNPNSYTGEDVAEISCHGSVYIQEQILKVLLNNGCRLADPGEYTMRAYIAGKMDLSQAEAVADLIESESKAAHQVAIQQMRGGFSEEIKQLREELIQFASLIELELDFGEEDVEFADRTELLKLLSKIKTIVTRLLDSFETGRVIKNGVPVAIVGAPNAGKSTLLNALLNEEKALVTDIPGTTRDAIEDEINIEGIKYRFIDTAGIRETKDLVESLGIKKTFEKIDQSGIVLYLFNAEHLVSNPDLIKNEIQILRNQIGQKKLVLVANKIDLISKDQADRITIDEALIKISALTKTGVDELISQLTSYVNLNALHSNQTIVTNARHAAELNLSLQDLIKVEEGMAAGISSDFIAMDIRQVLKHLGNIIGVVDVDQDILGTIFGKFCIGK